MTLFPISTFRISDVRSWVDSYTTVMAAEINEDLAKQIVAAINVRHLAICEVLLLLISFCLLALLFCTVSIRASLLYCGRALVQRWMAR